jgi:hypothetical protein
MVERGVESGDDDESLVPAEVMRPAGYGLVVGAVAAAGVV